MNYFPLLLALICISIGGASRAIRDGTHADSAITDPSKHGISGSENSVTDLTAIVSLLADRIQDLEDISRTDKQTIGNLGDLILYLESKIDDLEDMLKESRGDLSSLKTTVRSVEQRNLQLFNGPLTDRPIVNIGGAGFGGGGGGGGANANSDDNPCMPRYVNNRCIFGGTEDVVAIRFENATFFNDNVEFNENVGFDEDANCMPRYNATSNQCVLTDNFLYDSGTFQFQPTTKVTFRSREVWIRPRKTFFRNTNTSFQGGALNIGSDVDVIE